MHTYNGFKRERQEDSDQMLNLHTNTTLALRSKQGARQVIEGKGDPTNLKILKPKVVQQYKLPTKKFSTLKCQICH